MEGHLSWCHGASSSNNWDLQAVVRFACGDTNTPTSDDGFPWPGPLQPLLTDPAVDDLCQASKQEAGQPSSPAGNQQPAPAKPRTSGRAGGGPSRSKRKYVLYHLSSSSIASILLLQADC
jgi:hypothetical protein